MEGKSLRTSAITITANFALTEVYEVGGTRSARIATVGVKNGIIAAV